MSDMKQAIVEEPQLVPDKSSLKSYLPHNRHMVIDYPGVANVRVGNVSIPGNRLVVFMDSEVSGLTNEDHADLLRESREAKFDNPSGADLFNLYFQHRANLLITDWKLSEDGSIAVLMTTQLEREQVDDMAIVQEVVNNEMTKRRQEREDAKAKEAEAKEAEEREQQRLLDLAKKAEQQGWESRIKELEALNKKLSADIKVAKRGQ